jgi:hypothetical protein
MRMVFQTLHQSLLQEIPLRLDSLEKLLILNDLLYRKSSGTCLWEILESMSVTENASTWAVEESIGNFVVNKHSRNRLIATCKAFTNNLKVRNNVFFLPCMEMASTAHPTHDFVQNEEHTVLGAHFLHRREIAIKCWNTSECLYDVSWYRKGEFRCHVLLLQQAQQRSQLQPEDQFLVSCPPALEQVAQRTLHALSRPSHRGMDYTAR